MNTYTNAAGKTVTEHMTPEWPKMTDFDDFKPWPKGDKKELERPASSRDETPERKGEWLPESLVFSAEATPDIDGEMLLNNLAFSREVSPDLEGDLLPESPTSNEDVVASWHEDAQPPESPASSRAVSPAAEWGELSWPFSREVTPEPVVTYYTPQASDPDFDYIPLHEKRPAVSEHDRNHAEAHDWNTITSREEFDSDICTKVTAGDGTAIHRKPPYQMDLSEEVGTIGSLTSVNLDGFRVCCNPTQGGPPPRAEFHLVFEVSPATKRIQNRGWDCPRRVCTRTHSVPRHSLYGSNGRTKRARPRASTSDSPTLLYYSVLPTKANTTV